VEFFKEFEMQTNSEWQTGLSAWADFVARHPELGYRPGKYPFHNFLRHFRQELVQGDGLRKARSRHWVAHVERFNRIAFDCATGLKGKL
jgi:hypothetical protein